MNFRFPFVLCGLTLALFQLSCHSTGGNSGGPPNDFKCDTGFFARGMYGSDEPGATWDKFQSLGFNSANVGPYKGSLDDLQKRGMKGIVWLGDYNNGNPCGWENDDQWIIDHVTPIAGHPAILAYQISDEPEQDLDECPNVANDHLNRTNLIHTLDSSKPTYTVVSRTAYKTIAHDETEYYPYHHFVPTVDMLGLDIYPCRTDDPSDCHWDQITDAIAQAKAQNVIRYLAVLQDFNHDAWRFPTPDEIRKQFDGWDASKMQGYFIFSWDWNGFTLDSHTDDQAVFQEENARNFCGG